MLHLFKKRKSNSNPFQNWQIPVETDFRFINNGDSIQYVNADQSRVLYFSVLAVTGNSLLPAEALAKKQPSVARSESGWEFKGVRQGGNEVLVCVFSFINESDENWARALFANIVYIGK